MMSRGDNEVNYNQKAQTFVTFIGQYVLQRFTVIWRQVEAEREQDDRTEWGWWEVRHQM